MMRDFSTWHAEMSPLFQHPPLLSKHSFVSIVSLKQTGGSVDSSYPEQMAFNTAVLSNFPASSRRLVTLFDGIVLIRRGLGLRDGGPRYWRWFTMRVGKMVTSPRVPCPTCASCSFFKTGFSTSASGLPIHFLTASTSIATHPATKPRLGLALSPIEMILKKQD